MNVPRRALLAAFAATLAGFTQPLLWAAAEGRRASVFRMGVGNGGALLFLGTAHTNAADDPQLPDIREHLARFDPDLVLVEGGAWPQVQDPEAVVAQHGELAFAFNVARALGKPVEDADPDLRAQIRHVVAVHGADQAKLFYLLRMAPQYARAQARGAGALEASMQAWLRSAYMQEIAGTSAPITTTAQLHDACARLLPQLGDWKNAADPIWWRRQVDAPANFLPDVQDTSSAYRDSYLLRRIATELRLGHKVAVVAGGAHLDAVRTQLRAALAGS